MNATPRRRALRRSLMAFSSALIVVAANGAAAQPAPAQGAAGPSVQSDASAIGAPPAEVVGSLARYDFSALVSQQVRDPAGRIIPDPNSGSEPDHDGDRGGRLQLLVLALIAGGLGILGLLVRRDARSARRDNRHHDSAGGR